MPDAGDKNSPHIPKVRTLHHDTQKIGGGEAGSESTDREAMHIPKPPTPRTRAEKNSILTNRDDIFDVSRAFEPGGEAGTIVTDKRSKKPRIIRILTEAVTERVGDLKRDAQKLKIFEKHEPVTVRSTEQRKEVITEAGLHTKRAPRDDHRSIVKRLKSTERTAEPAPNEPILLRHEISEIPATPQWKYQNELEDALKEPIPKEQPMPSVLVQLRSAARLREALQKDGTVPEATTSNNARGTLKESTEQNEVLAKVSVGEKGNKIHRVEVPLENTPRPSTTSDHARTEVPEKPHAEKVAEVERVKEKSIVEEAPTPEITPRAQRATLNQSAQIQNATVHHRDVSAPQPTEPTPQAAPTQPEKQIAPATPSRETKAAESTGWTHFADGVSVKLDQQIPVAADAEPQRNESENATTVKPRMDTDGGARAASPLTPSPDVKTSGPRSFHAVRELLKTPVDGTPNEAPSVAEPMWGAEPKPVERPTATTLAATASFGEHVAVPPRPAITHAPAAAPKDERKRHALLLAAFVSGATLLGVLTAFFLSGFFEKDDAVVTESVRIPSFMATDAELPLTLPRDRATLLSTLRETIASSNVTLTHVYPVVGGAAVELPATTEQIFAVLDPRVSDRFIRSLGDTMMLGGIRTDASEPYLILRTNNFDVAFAAMIEWEPFLFADLAPLFGSSEELDGANFTDAVSANRGIRILRNDQGAELLVYAFINRETIVITSGTEALAALLSRL